MKLFFQNLKKMQESVQVSNFALVKKYGKGKEYRNCSVYGEKVEIVKEFEKGDKVYKNSIVKSLNKIENKEKENEEEYIEEKSFIQDKKILLESKVEELKLEKIDSNKEIDITVLDENSLLKVYVNGYIEK